MTHKSNDPNQNNKRLEWAMVALIAVLIAGFIAVLILQAHS